MLSYIKTILLVFLLSLSVTHASPAEIVARQQDPTSTPVIVGVCLTSTYTFPTVVLQPYTATSTFSTLVPSTSTSYRSSTVTTTLRTGGIITRTATVTVTSTFYTTTYYPLIICATTWITNSTSWVSATPRPTTIVSSEAALVTAFVQITTVYLVTRTPTITSSSYLATSTITSSYTTSSVICAAGAGNRDFK